MIGASELPVAERHWQFEMTRDAAARLQQGLEWALQHRNQRSVRALPTERLSMPTRQRLMGVLVVVGLLALGSLYALQPAAVRRSLGLYVATALLFLFFAIVAVYLPRFRAWSAKVAGSMHARQAARIFRRVRASAPYTVDLWLREGRIDSVATTGKHHVQLGSIATAYHTPDGFFLFRASALTPSRYVYVADPATHAAVLAALLGSGATADALTGPPAGYASPIAEARVHRG